MYSLYRIVYVIETSSIIIYNNKNYYTFFTIKFHYVTTRSGHTEGCRPRIARLKEPRIEGWFLWVTRYGASLQRNLGKTLQGYVARQSLISREPREESGLWPTFDCVLLSQPPPPQLFWARSRTLFCLKMWKTAVTTRLVDLQMQNVDIYQRLQTEFKIQCRLYAKIACGCVYLH